MALARDIRQRALQKIALLSASSPSTSFDRSDLDRLCKGCQPVGRGKEGSNGYASRQLPSVGRVPMVGAHTAGGRIFNTDPPAQNIRELEVLLALCKAAPSIKNGQSAQKLARQLIPYLLDAHVQAFVASPFLKNVEPSPTESLAFHVTAALLSLGTGFFDLQDSVSDNISIFLNSCSQAVDSLLPAAQDDGENPSLEEAIRTATIAVSLLGFLDAASAQAGFWRAGGRLAIVQRIRELLSERFLVTVETAFSTIRNSHSGERSAKEWKRYLRHYAAVGRPLGAVLLQRSFMWLLVATTSLLVAEPASLKGSHILDILLSGEGTLRPLTGRSADVDFRSVETYANIAIDQMNYLEASADFVRMGSSWQQRLAFTLKAAALTSYLNCSTLNEEAADADLLMNWLEETLADPLQMADETLASTVLQSMALICRISPFFAGSVSRLLPRFIVQGSPQASIVDVASKCLAYVLQMLSHDAVITTLYTLGNVLSPGSERPSQNGVNGDAVDGPPLSNVYAHRHSTGSAISLQMNGDEDSAIVCGNVVQAICGIAAACNDEKITALAQSMLLQKINKVNTMVDSQIITGAAALALTGGQLEFRSLLKMYSRVSHVGVVEKKDHLLDAVSTRTTASDARLTLSRSRKPALAYRPIFDEGRHCLIYIGSTCWRASSQWVTPTRPAMPRSPTSSSPPARLHRCCIPWLCSCRRTILPLKASQMTSLTPCCGMPGSTSLSMAFCRLRNAGRSTSMNFASLPCTPPLSLLNKGASKSRATSN